MRVELLTLAAVATSALPVQAQPASSPPESTLATAPFSGRSEAGPAASPMSDVVDAPDLALDSPTGAPENPTVTTPELAMTHAEASAPLPAESAGDARVAQRVTVDLQWLPKRLPFRNETSMEGYVLEESPKWWMIVGGGAMFAGGYVGSLVIAAEHHFDHGSGFAAVPLAGPWIAAARVGDCTEEDCDSDVRGNLLLTGVFQTVGAVLLPFGLLTTRKVWIREDLAVAVSATTTALSGQGLAVHGWF